MASSGWEQPELDGDRRGLVRPTQIGQGHAERQAGTEFDLVQAQAGRGRHESPSVEGGVEPVEWLGRQQDLRSRSELPPDPCVLLSVHDAEVQALRFHPAGLLPNEVAGLGEDADRDVKPGANVRLRPG
jgi:hypothetical protein